MPPLSADVVLLKFIIHDWNDDASRQIFKAAKSLLRNKSSKLLVQELILGERPAAFERFSRLVDLEMLACVPSLFFFCAFLLSSRKGIHARAA